MYECPPTQKVTLRYTGYTGHILCQQSWLTLHFIERRECAASCRLSSTCTWMKTEHPKLFAFTYTGKGSHTYVQMPFVYQHARACRSISEASWCHAQQSGYAAWWYFNAMSTSTESWTHTQQQRVVHKAVRSPIRFWLWEARCEQHSTSWQCIRVALFFMRRHNYVYSISLLLCCSALATTAHDHTCWLEVLHSSMLQIAQNSL